MNNLNKENFFDAMSEKYPKAMYNFCNWIDGYKAENNWDRLFNAGKLNPGGETLVTHAPKFHDLPYEMQFGILIRYCTETFAEEGNWIDLNEMRELFESCLIEINQS